MALALDGLRVIDADTHLTEAHDLWTKRAPAKYKDRVPHVEESTAGPCGSSTVSSSASPAAAGSSTATAARAAPLEALFEWTTGPGPPAGFRHQGAHRGDGRVRHLRPGLFPNSIGLGGQGISNIVKDPVLRLLCVQIYNDAMAEVQAESGGRFLPDAGAAGLGHRRVRAEAKRVAAMDLRGVNMTSDPKDLGVPTWPTGRGTRCGRSAPTSTCPVHFHIGASLHRHDLLRQLLLGVPARGHQAGHRRVDAVHQQRPRRHQHRPGRHPRPPPEAQDGVGRERRRLDPLHPRDHRLRDVGERPQAARGAAMLPSEYFHRNTGRPRSGSRRTTSRPSSTSVGEDSILFETDFPHPTCLYPKPLDTVAEKMRRSRPRSGARSWARTQPSCTGCRRPDRPRRSASGGRVLSPTSVSPGHPISAAPSTRRALDRRTTFRTCPRRSVKPPSRYCGERRRCRRLSLSL